jgi:hypothetical protein
VRGAFVGQAYAQARELSTPLWWSHDSGTPASAMTISRIASRYQNEYMNATNQNLHFQRDVEDG